MNSFHITSFDLVPVFTGGGPLRCELEDGMPGVGVPRWNVELLKISNGKPGVVTNRIKIHF